MRAVMFILAILFPESDLVWAATECAQPSPIVHIENLACSDSGRGKILYNKHQDSYRLNIYSNNETSEWYRGDFYGLDDD
jgi:hypothetical protein